MNKTALKNFAVWARKKLISDIIDSAGFLAVTENGIGEPLPESTKDLQLFDIGTKDYVEVKGIRISQRNSLVSAIRAKTVELNGNHKAAFEYIVEEVAYTWFNRMIAIRFMEVNDYLPIRVLSSESGKHEPDIVTSPFDAELDFTNEESNLIYKMRDSNKLEDLFRMLFIKQCNKLHDILPELFEKTNHYTEMLLTLSFTDTDSVVYHLVHDIPETDFNIEEEGQVQIIGWLYQYYNTEPKDKVFAALKKNVKISKENIPAATQLFTPHWIVRYMVENSLGRLWADGHGNFDRSGWKYYLEEAEQEESVKAQLAEIREEYKNISPEEIRFCDPCMGSGHILVCAFDVLMQIYLSQGYSERDAAAKIIRNNLYGLDIDKRAFQLAYFAIKMKAVQYDSRFLKRKETKHLEPNLAHFQGLDGVHNAAVSGALQDFAMQFKNCETYGSLLEVREVKGLDEALGDFSGALNMSFEQTEQMMRIYTVLSQKYHVVCTNPPYMGGSGMCAALAEFLKKNYPDSKSDLFAAFIERGLKLSKANGYNCMVTMQSWMFLSSFEKMREKILLTKTITNLMHMENMVMGIAFGTAVSVINNRHIKGYKGTYNHMTLADIKDEKPVEFPVMKNRFAQVSAENFSKIPGAPVAYWVSENVINCFDNNSLIDDVSYPRQGLATGDNNKFLRLWHEVNFSDLKINANSLDEFFETKCKYIPYNKGGAYRKWFANLEHIIRFDREHYTILSTVGNHLPSRDFYFRESITWSKVTSGGLSMRYIPKGSAFDVAGCSIFCDNNLNYILGFVNSHIMQYLMNVLSQTLNYEVGSVKSIPIIFESIDEVESIVKDNISLSRNDSYSFETSWDFKKHPLLNGEKTVSKAFDKWSAECEQRFNQLKSNEEELNRIFIDIYGLQDELTPEVEDKDVTVRKADLQREIKSLLSYAVGCMFGRYCLNKEGLVYAGGNFEEVYWKYQGMAALDVNGKAPYGGYAGMTMAKYHYAALRDKPFEEWNKATYLSFFPDLDNCIPITDEEYFKDDIVVRFVEFIRTVYGADTLEQNLNYIADALGTKGNTSRERIRNYFLNDFIKDHIKTYQKRPIYWLFDSGRQNGFKALVYMHRWNADTTGNVRVEYLHKLQRMYENEIRQAQDVVDDGGSAREVSAAQKRIEKLTKQLKETRDYDEKIAHLAVSRIDIDLDDGVKVNYDKVQTGVDGKKIEILTKI